MQDVLVLLCVDKFLYDAQGRDGIHAQEVYGVLVDIQVKLGHIMFEGCNL